MKRFICYQLYNSSLIHNLYSFQNFNHFRTKSSWSTHIFWSSSLIIVHSYVMQHVFIQDQRWDITQLHQKSLWAKIWISLTQWKIAHLQMTQMTFSHFPSYKPGISQPRMTPAIGFSGHRIGNLLPTFLQGGDGKIGFRWVITSITQI